jgi:ribose transport system ATP-binding protein
MTPLLSCRSISKSYPGVRSLNHVNFSANSGEIHGLVGENGAGKSTLVRIIAGAVKPDDGKISFGGREVVWGSPREARKAGIHVIHQELMLFAELTVAENIFCGAEPRNLLGFTSDREMRRRAARILADLGVRLDVDRRIGDLTVADRQMIEIAKALVDKVELLILDEPTAVISGREAALLFDRLKRLRDQGVAIIYISHRLEELFELADRATVLKDGAVVGTEEIGKLDRWKIIRMMVGRELGDLYPSRGKGGPSGQTLLKVENLSDGARVRDVSFTVNRGEIVGLAGMVGAGRTETAHLIFGSRRRTGGEIYLSGEPLRNHTSKSSIARGVGFLTEDRKGEGLLMQLGIAANITAPRLRDIARSLLLDIGAESSLAKEEIAKFSIAARGPDSLVLNLSGGNQQKVLFSRWMRICSQLLILDEPTRGVDVGAKADIYRIIRRAAEDGLGVLMISSELPELIGMCDRVFVLRQGVTMGDVSGTEMTEEAIVNLATFDQ